jgi:hypothetical protein
MTFSNISQMSFVICDKQKKFLKGVDDICRSNRQYEEKLNEKIIPEFGKVGMLGCPISRRYGSLGYDLLTYVLAIDRIGEEGNSLRTFFSAQALTEPLAGSGPSSMVTKFEHRGKERRKVNIESTRW